MLGGCGRGKGQSHPSEGRANLGDSGAVWNVKEEKVKQWAAEMVVALEALHEQGVLCQDLNPRNLLLDQAGRSPSHTAPALLLRWDAPRVKGTPKVMCYFPLPASSLSCWTLLQSGWPLSPMSLG